VYLGARYWSIDPKITVQVNATRFRIGDQTEWVDPLVGLRFGIDLSSTVMMLIGGDVGGFNLGNYSSDFTWSQITSLSWRVSDSVKLYVGYKFLDVHQKSGDLDTRMQTRGPFIAAGYVF
jgi:opacity protein-like surface antigen